MHLFDTFEDLPEINNIDAEYFYEKQYAASLEDVKKLLKEYDNVHFYKGVFPDTASAIKNKKFSFVHLDADLYKSTLDCLEFFYPKMNKGGIIMSHDYNSKFCDGVQKAFDEFFQDKPEPILEMLGSQCLIVKL